MGEILLECPKCKLPSRAILNKKFNKFIIYTCPSCKSNVVYYGNKVDIISDKLLNKLIKGRRLKFNGAVHFMGKEYTMGLKKRNRITEDDILNLRILLETEEDTNRIISKL